MYLIDNVPVMFKNNKFSSTVENKCIWVDHNFLTDPVQGLCDKDNKRFRFDFGTGLSELSMNNVVSILLRYVISLNIFF